MAEVAVYNELVLLQPPDEALRRWEMTMSPALSQGGYKLTEKQADSAVYVRRYSPGWTILVAIFLFPIGLLALLARQQSNLLVSFESYGSGTMVKVSGSTTAKGKRWLDNLAAEMNERARAATQAEA
jgi:hypothetical protein